jgi:NADPH-dependent 2,4-dienoyl-CoA reductase/sulfur reductase-like enzyme
MILPAEKKVITENGDTFHYDILIIATGASIAPEETEGMRGDDMAQKHF